MKRVGIATACVLAMGTTIVHVTLAGRRAESDVAPQVEAAVEALPPTTAEYVPRDWNTVQIRLERTTCLGTCPSYGLRIHGDGEVEWNGRMWVDVTGAARRCIDRGAIERVLARFSAERFFDPDTFYSDGALDVPSAAITLSIDGRTKQVDCGWMSRAEHEWLAREHGRRIDEARVDSLERLDALASAIDDAGGTAWWRGRIRTSQDHEDARREQALRAARAFQRK